MCSVIRQEKEECSGIEFINQYCVKIPFTLRDNFKVLEIAVGLSQIVCKY